MAPRPDRSTLPPFLRPWCSYVAGVLTFAGTVLFGQSLLQKFHLWEGADFLAARIVSLPVLWSTVVPFVSEPTRSIGDTDDTKNHVDSRDGLIGRVRRICNLVIHAAAIYMAFFYAPSADVVICGLQGAILSTIAFFAVRLFLLPTIDFTRREGSSQKLDTVFLYWTAFSGLVAGTYAHHFGLVAIPAFYTAPPGLVPDIPRAVLAVNGLYDARCRVQHLQETYLSQGALLNALRDHPRTFLRTALSANLWALGVSLVIAALWPCGEAQAFWGPALLGASALLVGQGHQRPGPAPGSVPNIAQEEEGKTGTPDVAPQSRPSWRTLLVTSLYWGPATQAVTQAFLAPHFPRLRHPR